MKKHRKVRCVRRADGAVVHRTRPIRARGRCIGHVCSCRQVVMTEGSQQSRPTEIVNGQPVATRAHQRRVAAA